MSGTIDYVKYRQSPLEQERMSDFLRLLPRGCATVLDIGCRDGYVENMLVRYFDRVTALDLEQPHLEMDRVTPVAGDVTRLQFPDDSFDVVCCLEVLEHIPPPQLRRACHEIARVARRQVIVGVPYRQDLRVSRTTCRACGATNPPWAHVNRFDERRLRDLFAELTPCGFSFVGKAVNRTTWLAALLMNWGGNPWGSYNQEEPCIHCGRALVPPTARSPFQRACSAAAASLNAVQQRCATPSPIWIHAHFTK